MRKEQKPPIHARMLDEQGNLNPLWVRWFQTVGKYFDNYRKSHDLYYSISTTLTTNDFGKSIVFNVGAGTLMCTLPTITTKDIHCWIGPIYRIGTGRLIITADSASRIETSTYGGSLYCEENPRIAGNVTLEVVMDHQWGIIGATGLWYAD